MPLKKSKHNMPDKDRFEQGFVKGEPHECWPWLGSLDKKGYGRFRFKSYNTRAHKASHLIYKGPIPEKMETLHSCDNKVCVNPLHLSYGTPLRNQHEAWARDLKKNCRKLSPEDVLAIRASTETHNNLSARYGVVPSQISRIRSGVRGNGILLMLSPLAQSVGG